MCLPIWRDKPYVQNIETMKQFYAFILKEAHHILRDKRTMLMLFGMPLAMMLLFGYAISTDVKNVRMVVVLSPWSDEAQQAVDRLAASSYFTLVGMVHTPAEAEQTIRHQQADMAIIFGESNAAGVPSMQFLVDGTDPNMAQQWQSYAQAVVMHAGDGLVSTKMLYNPQLKSAYNFVPAIMGMLLMLVCAMMTSISIVREKEQGTMEVLLVSPTRPLLMIAAKLVPYLVIAFGILALILLIAAFVLGVPVVGSLFWIIVLSTLYILLALSLGLLISNVAQTQLAALLISAMLLLMPIVMLSGMIYPLESMPEVLQWISTIIPTRYYISGMRKLMIMGVGVGQVVGEMMVLLGMLVVLLTLSLRLFKIRLE